MDSGRRCGGERKGRGRSRWPAADRGRPVSARPAAQGYDVVEPRGLPEARSGRVML
ncbi:hypothetical protein HMPREF9057_01175, partial [Actinomyces sp. oral taxon 171 str. F0337]